MDFQHIFLSFNGRLRRSHFWVGIVILWVVEMVIMMALVMPGMTAAASGGSPGPLMLVGQLLLLVLIWPALAVQVKRWHDRDKSGWWVLISLIPLIGFIWVIVECGILDGTPGPNKFGPSPKGVSGPAAVAT
ncbi:MAG TPA: DUF805 domain-containing protein [Caulobacteraceae bacterium]|jgi:uncharacterized membrane protein YhaH (DUF805 family)|nr:DUF805 domain-containing protein [Caulobacteraceae bacterium]